MNTTENIRLACLQLAASYLSAVSNDLPTFIEWAQKFYDFVTEQPAAATSDPQAPYEVSYIAEKPSGAISREWLYDKLIKMRFEAASRKSKTAPHTAGMAELNGVYNTLQAVIDLISPKKQCEN